MTIKTTSLVNLDLLACNGVACRIRPVGVFRRSGIAIVLLLIPFGMVSDHAESRANAAPADSNVIEQAERGWSEYVKRTRFLQQDVTFNQKDLATNEVTRSRLEKCRQIGNDMRLFAFDDRTGDGHDSVVWAFNPNYAFRLIRKPATDTWVINRLIRREGAPESTGLPQDFAWYFEEDKRVALNINGIPLRAIVHDASFRATGVSFVEEGGDKLARVEFIYEPSDRRNSTRGGWMMLDPAHCWVVRQFEVGGAWPDGNGTIRGNYDYDIRQDGLPLLKRMVKRQGLGDGSSGIEISLDLKSYEDPNVAPAEFTLSAFGLPEPNSQLYLGRVSWLVWLDALIVAALLLFCSVQFISRRRRFSIQG